MLAPCRKKSEVSNKQKQQNVSIIFSCQNNYYHLDSIQTLKNNSTFILLGGKYICLTFSPTELYRALCLISIFLQWVSSVDLLQSSIFE